MPLITFEGIDGAGKTSVLQACLERLTADGVAACRMTDFSHVTISQLLKPELTSETRVLAQYFDVMCARALTAKHALQPALALGKVVLYDRYFDSTLAYQGVLGVDAGRIFADHIQLELPMPLLTIVLDISPDVAKARVRARGGAADVFERYNDSFYAVARHVFKSIDASNRDRTVIVPADSGFEAVVANCMRVITERLALEAAA